MLPIIGHGFGPGGRLGLGELLNKWRIKMRIGKSISDMVMYSIALLCNVLGGNAKC